MSTPFSYNRQDYFRIARDVVVFYAPVWSFMLQQFQTTGHIDWRASAAMIGSISLHALNVYIDGDKPVAQSSIVSLSTSSSK